eukprot:326675-Chlamydomonas_euryale.AAC.6
MVAGLAATVLVGSRSRSVLVAWMTFDACILAWTTSNACTLANTTSNACTLAWMTCNADARLPRHSSYRPEAWPGTIKASGTATPHSGTG